MGIADNMADLRQEITDAGSQRHELISETKQNVSELKQNVSELLKGYAEQRQEMAAELRTELKQSVSELKNSVSEQRSDSDRLIADYARIRQEMAAELRTELKQSVSELKNTVSEQRSDSDRLIADYARMRQEMAAELRTELNESASELKNADARRRAEFAIYNAENTRFVTDLRNYTNALLENYSDEHAAMRRAWHGMDPDAGISPQILAATEVKPEPVAGTVQSDQVEGGGIGDDLEGLKIRMLEIITGSAGGISLAEIGDKMGVEWRKLIRPARDLLENEQVRKEDVNYFPEVRYRQNTEE